MISAELITRNVIMKKLALLTYLVLTTSITYADHCPSINDIKANKANDWKAFDSDNHKPLSAHREAKLKHSIVHFALAEWTNEDHKNIVHCYYNNANGSDMEAYFAKEKGSSILPSKYWYAVTGLMQCAASAEKCGFQRSPEIKHRLVQSDLTKRAS